MNKYKTNTSARKKLTHFLNFPILDKTFIDSFYKFIEEVKAINYWVDDSYHISEILQFSTNLHFTLCVLNLESQDQINMIDKLLYKLQPKITELIQNKNLILSPDKFDNFGSANKAKVIFL